MASYRIEISQQARLEIRRLPGNLRQRILHELNALQQEPRPHHSRLIDLSKANIQVNGEAELRRLRLTSWRVVYFVEPEWACITILTVRKRPPYDYSDLQKLVEDAQ